MNNLLRIEAVNLRYIIDDTEDLSVRRGGGYMLLEAIRDIAKKFSASLTPISTGASIGLFQTTAATPDLVSDIRQYLTQHQLYRHATFVISSVTAENFKDGVEKVIALNRWEQMNTPSFSTQWGASPVAVCGVDEVRPANLQNQDRDDTTVAWSASCHARKIAGVELRQTFYGREAGISGINFTDNLEELCSFDNEPEYQELPPNLNGKIAIFYADGNSFGKIQSHCQSADDLKKWDSFIKEQRKTLLKTLVEELRTSPLALNKGKLRLETLMWGGDELLFAMPAWLGLEFAERFFQLTATWRSPFQASHQPAEHLTHGAGLVFAHHNAPIRLLQSLAKNIAEEAKYTAKNRDQLAENVQHRFPSGNTLAWIALESFDYSGNNLDAYWKRVSPLLTWEKMLLEHSVLHTLRSTLANLKEPLPKSAMVRVLRCLSHEVPNEHYALIGRSYESVVDRLNAHDKEQHIEGSYIDFAQLWKQLLPASEHADFAAFSRQILDLKRSQNITALSQTLNLHAPAWTTILELWDYTLPNTFTPKGARV